MSPCPFPTTIAITPRALPKMVSSIAMQQEQFNLSTYLKCQVEPKKSKLMTLVEGDPRVPV